MVQIMSEERTNSSVIKYSVSFQGRLGYIPLLHYLDQLKLPKFSLTRLGSVIPSKDRMTTYEMAYIVNALKSQKVFGTY